ALNVSENGFRCLHESAGLCTNVLSSHSQDPTLPLHRYQLPPHLLFPRPPLSLSVNKQDYGFPLSSLDRKTDRWCKYSDRRTHLLISRSKLDCHSYNHLELGSHLSPE